MKCLIVVLSLLGCCCCKPDGQRVKVQDVAAVPQSGFTRPIAPAVLTGEAERAGYLVLHWWDRFSFEDTTLIHRPDVAEQAFADFLATLQLAGEEQVAGAVKRFLSGAEREATGRMYEYFLGLSEHYLYEPNSPMRNEDAYLHFLRYILNDSTSDETKRIRPASQLEEIGKNRLGAIAADFAYTQADGRQGRLHGIASDYTLLLFHSPDCGECDRVKAVLKSSSTVARLISGGRLQILFLYPFEDMAEWEKGRSGIPSAWINARDASEGFRIKEELYSIRSAPSIYLLDREKRVLLKDATVERAIQGLNN